MNTNSSIFSLSDDLKLQYGDVRAFTRNEALRAIIIKFQILKDFTLIQEYLESIITDQGQQFFLINPEQSAQSIAEFFSDLRKLALGLPAYDIDDFSIWRKELIILLSRFENAAAYCAYGRYSIAPRSRTKERTENLRLPLTQDTELIHQYINRLSSAEEPKEEREIYWDDIREALKVSKAETWKKYFPQLGIEIFGSKNNPHITESDFQKLRKFWFTRK